jgi:hypothetical protein
VSRSSVAQGYRRYVERHEDEQAIKFAIATNPVLASRRAAL